MEDEKKEEVNHGLKLIVKTSVFVFFAFILSKIFGYLYRIIIARYFGPEIYGIFSLSTIILGWFVTFASLGFMEGIVRFISVYRGREEVNKIRFLVRYSSLILFISTVSSALILFLSSEFLSIRIFHNSELIPFLKFFSIIMPFWVFATYYLSIMRAFEKIKEGSIIESGIYSFSKIFLVVIFIFLGLNINAIIFSFFSGIMLMFFLSYFYSRKNLSGIFLKYALSRKNKKEISIQFIKYSWPMLLFGLLNFFYWGDSFLIGFFKSAVEVGLYNAIVPIAILLNLVPEMFMQLFFPLITKHYSTKNFEFIKEISKQVGKWTFMINLPIFLIIFFFPETIINLLFGYNYLSSVTPLRILLFGALFSSIGLISNNLLLMAGKSRIILYGLLIAGFLNITLDIILIPLPFIFGIDNFSGTTGAAIATTISLIILNLLYLFQAKRCVSIIPLKKEMFKTGIAALLSSLIIISLNNFLQINPFSFFIILLLFLIIYFALIFLFKGFNEEDIMLLNSLKMKLMSQK